MDKLDGLLDGLFDRAVQWISDAFSPCPLPKMKAVAFVIPGHRNVLKLKEVPYPIIKSDEIMIKITATGLNIYDVWRRRGVPAYITDWNPYLGYECSGKVVAVGSTVSEFNEGDEVCALLRYGGGYAEFVAVHKYNVVRIPSGVSVFNAAALPQASCLTFYTLTILKKLVPGQRILIHEAAGGIGIIALQYAKHVGCKVFAIAGKEEMLQLCEKLGAEICINYKKEDFCKRVMAETGEEGVDIILDLSEKDHFRKNIDCLATSGSLVLLGLRRVEYVNIDLSVLMKKDVTVIGGNLRNLNSLEIRSLLSDVESKFWPLIEAGYIKPIIGKYFTFSEAVEAHLALEEYGIAGKLLLVPPETTQCDIGSSIIPN